MKLSKLVNESLEKATNYRISFGSDFSNASRFVLEATTVAPAVTTQSVNGRAVVHVYSADEFQLLQLEEIAHKYGVTIEEGPATVSAREKIKKEKMAMAEKHSKMMLDAKKQDLKDGKGSDDVEEATLPSGKTVPESRFGEDEPDGPPNTESKEPSAKTPPVIKPESIDSVPNSEAKSLPSTNKPADNKPGKPAKPETKAGQPEKYKGIGKEVQPSDLYPKIDGFDGPFQFPNAQVLYWDYKESKYWDKNTSKHLNNDELPLLEESSPWCGTDMIVEHKNGVKTKLTQEQHDTLYHFWKHVDGLNKEEFVKSILESRSSLMLAMVK